MRSLDEGATITEQMTLRETDPGCQTLIGYQIWHDRKGGCQVSLDVSPAHINRNGILHGGIVATLLDVVCGNTASLYFAGDGEDEVPVVTVSLNIAYLTATRSEKITATARVMGGGRSTLHVLGELHDENGTCLANATGVFRRIKRR